MDWENEPYVKVYTRETDDDLVLSWEALALWRAMLLKFDRSGLIETRRGTKGLSALVKIPLGVIDRVLPELLTDGRVQAVPEGYLAPNFIAAQEARKSDKLRQRETRERRRTRSLSGVQEIETEAADRRAAAPDVTKRDENGESVTKRDQTSREVEPHEQNVTLCSAETALHSERCSAPARTHAHDPGVPPARPEPPGDPAAAYDPTDPRARGRLTERLYRRLSDARIQVAAELGLPPPLPFPEVSPSGHTRGFRDLRERLVEEGANAPRVGDAVVNTLIAQARERQTIEWLSEKAFTEGAWRTARDSIGQRTARGTDADGLVAPRRAPTDRALGANALAIFGGQDEVDAMLAEVEAERAARETR